MSFDLNKSLVDQLARWFCAKVVKIDSTHFRLEIGKTNDDLEMATTFFGEAVRVAGWSTEGIELLSAAHGLLFQILNNKRRAVVQFAGSPSDAWLDVSFEDL